MSKIKKIVNDNDNTNKNNDNLNNSSVVGNSFIENNFIENNVIENNSIENNYKSYKSPDNKNTGNNNDVINNSIIMDNINNNINGDIGKNNLDNNGSRSGIINIKNQSAPKVCLIIVNYNGINYIGECLDSIYNQTYKNFFVLVIDNNSKDGSVSFIKKNYPKCEILINFANKGYGYAFNKAVKFALKKYKDIKYFAILNNDLRFDEKWLESLVTYGEKKKESGILAGKMLIYYWPKYINSTGGLVNYFGIGWDRDFFEIDGECDRESGEVLSVSGGAALIKKEVFDEVGFFENKYFMYYEDIDFCFKTWKFSDFTVDYVKDAIVYHKFSTSSGVLSLKKHFYLKRARFIFILRNYPIGFLIKIIPQITKYEFGFIMKDLLVRYDFANFFREFYIYLIFLAKLPLILGKRLIKKDNKDKLRVEKAKKMWGMVSTTTTNSGRKHIPLQYLDMLWNRFEKYGEKTNRIIMGINDVGLGRGWKSLITKGYPRGRFFFNYADLILENPYRGDSYKYYFQLQYFLYDKKEQDLYVLIEDEVFNLKLFERMHTTIIEVPASLLKKSQKEVGVIFTFKKDFLNSEGSNFNYYDSTYFDGNLEKMNNIVFKEYVKNFNDLFVIEVALLSEDSQYLRKELFEK